MNRIKNRLLIASCTTTQAPAPHTAARHPRAVEAGRIIAPDPAETFAEIPSVSQAPVPTVLCRKEPSGAVLGRLY